MGIVGLEGIFLLTIHLSENRAVEKWTISNMSEGWDVMTHLSNPSNWNVLDNTYKKRWVSVSLKHIVLKGIQLGPKPHAINDPSSARINVPAGRPLTSPSTGVLLGRISFIVYMHSKVPIF